MNALTPKDLINLSKTTQDLLHREITKMHLNAKKLQQNLDKAEGLLKLEKVVIPTRVARIQDLEAKIMWLGLHPREAETTKAVIKEKDKPSTNS